MNPQDRTDGAVAGRQEGSYGQELGLDPDAVGEQWSEGGQDGYDLRWQIQGGRSPRTMARMSPSIVANDPLDRPADLAKVEMQRLAKLPARIASYFEHKYIEYAAVPELTPT